jgi:hypothetical protein
MLSSAARTKTNKSFFGSFFQKRTRLLFEKRSKNFSTLVPPRSRRAVASSSGLAPGAALRPVSRLAQPDDPA